MSKHITIGAAILGTLLIMVALFMRGGSDATPGFRALSGTVYTNALHETPSALLIDVRTPAEFSDGHITGAQNLDMSAPGFAEELAKLDRTTPYFIYCHSGNRSGQVRVMMQQMGFENVTDLKGGVAGSPELLTSR